MPPLRRRGGAWRPLAILSVCLACLLGARGYDPEGWNPSDGICGDKGPWTEEMCHTDTDGVENDYCVPCLVGEEWDKVRAQLGTDLIKGYRATIPTVKYGEWSTSTLMTGAFRIILQELLGYEVVRTATTNSLHGVEQSASEICQAINMEVWSSDGVIEAGDAVKLDYVGLSGQEGLFVPNYAPFEYTNSAAISGSGPGAVDLMKLFPPDGSRFDVDKLTEEFPNGDPWGCSETGWSASTCNTGRWYPEQCGDSYPSPQCAELYIAEQHFSEGWWEAVVGNLGLNFSVVYTGMPGFRDALKDIFEQEKLGLYYWWQPEPLLLKYPSVPFAVPSNNQACRTSQDNDPSLSGVDCGPQIRSLQKMINAQQAVTDPDIYHLWYGWNVKADDLDKLMALHVDGGGPHSSYYSASCEWLKSTKDEMDWLSWVSISNPCGERDSAHVLDPATGACVPAEVAAASGSLSLRDLLLAVLGGGCLVLVTGMVIAAVCMWNKNGSVSKEGPPAKGSQVTLVITDIQGSTSLWDEYPQEVVKAIAVHHQCLRANLSGFNGYEVATEGDSFKCAFHTPEDAICWSIAIQLDLLCAPWDPKLEDGGVEKLGTHTWPQVSELRTPAATDDFPVHLLLENMQAARVPETQPHTPIFSASAAGSTEYCKEFLDKCPDSGVMYKGLKLPVFRGMLVRIGIHTGMADVTGVHSVTKRVTYGGKVACIAKAVSDIPCGGQIVMSGESLAAVSSTQDLMQRVAEHFKDWSSTLDTEVHQIGSSASFVHCGSHIIQKFSRTSMTGLLAGGALSLTKTLKKMRDDAQDVHGPGVAPGAQSGLDDNGAPLCDRVTKRTTSRYNQVGMPRLEKKIGQVEEIVMVIPWPLRARVRCFPPLSTEEAVTPSYFEAPSGENTTIMFTFISGWAQMKKTFADNLDVVAATQHKYAILVRSCLLRCDGYEMEGEDDSFVCAFHSAADAVDCAVMLQKHLRESKWDSRLSTLSNFKPLYAKESGMLIANGPRVKVGMCTGTPTRSQPCLRTGRRIYLGSIMNHAARVAVKAKGGQVLLHETTFTQLGPQALSEQAVVTPFRLESLKGVNRKVQLYHAYEVGHQHDDRKESDSSEHSGFLHTFFKKSLGIGPGAQDKVSSTCGIRRSSTDVESGGESMDSMMAGPAATPHATLSIPPPSHTQGSKSIPPTPASANTNVEEIYDPWGIGMGMSYLKVVFGHVAETSDTTKLLKAMAEQAVRHNAPAQSPS